MADYLDALCDQLDTDLDSQGRAHADCPFCAAPGFTRTGKPAYHFYLYDRGGKRGASCWSCGWRGSLAQLAAALKVQGSDSRAPRQAPARPQLPWEQPNALARYQHAMAARWTEVVGAWQAYKPLRPETIRRGALGLGLLPFYDEKGRRWYQGRHPRLLAPLVEQGRLVGIAGRAYLPEDDGPKWLTASYSTLILHGLEDVQPGDVVIWVENRVDRLLIEEHEPGVKALASGGLTWQPAWLDALAARRPKHVLIWFDCDLSGCPNPETYTRGKRAWLRKMQERVRRGEIPTMPAFQEPRGPQLANELLAREIKASCYRWPNGSPEHADVGSALLAERQSKRAA